MMKKTKEPLFKKPQGTSRLGPLTNGHWGETITDRRIVSCEICGSTRRPKEPVSLNWFLDRQMVEECCGQVLDDIFKSHGLAFTLRVLENFKRSPDDPKFTLLVNTLQRTLHEIWVKNPNLFYKIFSPLKL